MKVKSILAAKGGGIICIEPSADIQHRSLHPVHVRLQIACLPVTVVRRIHKLIM